MPNLVYILTCGRADAQHTLECLPPALWRRTRLVVQAGELSLHERKGFPVPLLCLPFGIDRLGSTRKWITQHAKEKSKQGFYVLDDDIRFARRVSPDGVKLRRLEPADPELEELFVTLDEWLTCGGVGMVGLSPRHGNHFVPGAVVKYNQRISQFLGYRTSVAARVQWDRVQLYTEHDITLQILRHGYASKVSFEWAYEPVADYQTPGGASKWRTATMENAAAEEMFKLHEPFAKMQLVTDRRYKTHKEQIHQTKFQWKKAYMSGLPEELK